MSRRGLWRNFGLKLGTAGKAGFAGRVRELVNGAPTLLAIAEPLLAARAALLHEAKALHRQVLRTVRDDAVCRRLMTAPGVGPPTGPPFDGPVAFGTGSAALPPIVALAFKSAVDEPGRFAHSRAVGAHLGLTPKRYQSGEVDRSDHITRAGDATIRTLLD